MYISAALAGSLESHILDLKEKRLINNETMLKGKFRQCVMRQLKKIVQNYIIMHLKPFSAKKQKSKEVEL